MDISISRNTMLKGLEAILPVAAKKEADVMEIVTMAKFDTNVARQTLEISATDLTTSMKMRLTGDLKIAKESSFILPAQTLYKIVKANPMDAIDISHKGDSVTIISNGSIFKLPAGNIKEFPEIAEEDPKNAVIMLPRKTLIDMFKKTTFCSSDEKSRYSLDIAFIKCNTEDIEVICTDGVRLAIAKTECEVPQALQNQKVLVKVNTVKALQKSLNFLAGDDIALTFQNNFLVLLTDEAQITGILAQGKFPPYQKAIPKKTPTKVAVSSQALLHAVTRVQHVIDRQDHISLAFDESCIIIEGRSSFGEGKVTVSNATTAGKPIQAFYRPAYLTEALKAMSFDSITIDLSQDGVMVLREHNYLHCLCPIVIPEVVVTNQ